MTWCNTAEVPTLGSFAQAKARFENTKPIRGNKDKVRPLGNRNKHRMASFDMPDADTVVLKYYGEPFVTWRSDDSFSVTNSVYNSSFSARHLPYFLPTRWATNWNACRMTIGNKGKYYLFPKGETLHFVKAGDDFELVNKPVAYAIRKRRGSDRTILAKCAPFFDWLTVVSAVNNSLTEEETKHAINLMREQVGLQHTEWYQKRVQEMYTDASITTQDKEKRYADYRMIDSLPFNCKYTHLSARSFHTASCERILQWVEDDNAENWVLAMNLIAERAGNRRYKNNSIQYDLSVEQATKFMAEIARHVHRDSIFYNEQLEDGVVPTRSNAVYLRSFSFSL
jgi:hypothetical protein